MMFHITPYRYKTVSMGVECLTIVRNCRFFGISSPSRRLEPYISREELGKIKRRLGAGNYMRSQLLLYYMCMNV